MNYLQQCFYRGISLWAGWLPVLATTVYVFVLGMNITRDEMGVSSALSLRDFIGTTEMLVFFVLIPLFFTRINNLVAAAATCYGIERLILSSYTTHASPAVLLFFAALVTIALLGDKMPWLNKERPNDLAHRMREILVIVISFAAVGVIISTLINAQAFHLWLIKYIGIKISISSMVIILGFVFFAWISVALGVTRHFILPLICLPSIIILAYVTHWPNYMLLICFVASLNLALAVVDQRLVSTLRKA